jgi:hypothetical protein
VSMVVIRRLLCIKNRPVDVKTTVSDKEKDK